MSIFEKLFGKKPADKTVVTKLPIRVTDPSKDPNMIRVYDQYGRELFISRDEWRKSVLGPNLKKVWNNPDELYNLIISALGDGFRSDVVDAAHQLYKIDTNPIRGACIWGIVLMEEDRLNEAETVFRDVTAKHGETGVIFTNWAKVHAKRNDDAKVEQYLWHALELDPNQDNGLLWYESLHREKGGEAAGLEAFQRVATLPGSWRAKLWIARAYLEKRQLNEALQLYMKSLTEVSSPVPTDLLKHISSDLGNNGYLPEILDLCVPRFIPEYHGIEVGNNLIKVYFDLGQLDAARNLLNQLYALKRPDWKNILSYWDTEIARTNAENTPATKSQLEIGISTLAEPLWLRHESPAESLFAPKDPDAPIIAFLGGSAETGATQEKHGLSDTPGRVSRFLPLFLAEQIHLQTSAVGKVLIPRVINGGSGFVVCGVPFSAEQGCHMARQGEPIADYLAITHLKATQEPYRVEMTVYRTIDQAVIGKTQTSFPPAQPETAFRFLSDWLEKCLHNETPLSKASNPLYQVPRGTEFTVHPFPLFALQ